MSDYLDTATAEAVNAVGRLPLEGTGYADMAKVAVATAAPFIEVAVREQIAADIEARLRESDGWESHPNAFLWGVGMSDAARIARGIR